MKKKSVKANRDGGQTDTAAQVEDAVIYENETDAIKKLYPRAADEILDGVSSLYSEMFNEMESGGMQLISEVAAYIAWRQRRDVAALTHIVSGLNCTEAKQLALGCWHMWDKHVLSAIERAKKKRLAESAKNGRRPKPGRRVVAG